MRAALYTPGFSLPLVYSQLATAYQARIADPSAVMPHNQNYWERANWRLNLEKDAKKSFGNVEWLRSGPERLHFAIKDTEDALHNAKHPLLNGASFFANVSPNEETQYGFYARTFLLEPASPDRTHVGLYEVACGTEPTKNELMQMALQQSILQRSGLVVDQATLLVASAAELSAKRESKDHVVAFQKMDVTEAVRAALPDALKHLDEVQKLLIANPPQTNGNNPANADDTKAQPIIPVTALVDSKLKYWIINRLTALGITDLGQIPLEFPGLNDAQRAQIRAKREGHEFVHIDRPGLKKHFEGRKYPVHYLDFETKTEILPDGSRRDTPFQFSDHIMHEDGRIVHASFIADGSKDPREQFAECLAASLKGAGTIVVYYKKFEVGCIQETAAYLRTIGRGALADEIESFISRVDDQYDYVKKFVQHSGFNGSNSLKSVYPALVKNPATTYKQLTIKNGLEATTAIAEICDPNVSAERKAALATALEAYCALDTYAMIEIDHVLMAWANEAQAA